MDLVNEYEKSLKHVESELVETKLALVESQCTNQGLVHQAKNSFNFSTIVLLSDLKVVDKRKCMDKEDDGINSRCGHVSQKQYRFYAVKRFLTDMRVILIYVSYWIGCIPLVHIS
jgi:hypothetical protein